MENENQILRNELNNYKLENDKLRIEINKLIFDNKRLTTDLIIANNKISYFNNIMNNNNNNNLGNTNIINDLHELITVKDKEINDLKLQLQMKPEINKRSVNFNDIMIVHFVSQDNKINYAIKCLKTDRFAEVEEQLYQKYSEYRETNNNFLIKDKIVLRFKTISENNIQIGDKIQLINSK